MVNMRNRIFREQKIIMNQAGIGYQISDNKGEVLVGSEEDYFIYFKNVNFRQDGTIEGRYLGVASDKLIDGYSRDVMYDTEDGVWKTVDKNNVRTARMVAINNKTNVTIILHNN